MPRSPQPASPDWDAPTLLACQRGDRQAQERVLRAELPILERTLARLVGSRVELADVLQKTCLAAVRGFPRFRGEASVRTWLTSIAVRTALEHLRTSRRKLELVAVPNIADERVSPHTALEARRRLAAVRRHLLAIEPNKRVAFVLHVVEGRPIDEVAALVGASRAATKSRVFFARRELLARLRRDPAARELFEGGLA